MPRRPISHLEDSIAELRNANKVGRFLIGFFGPVLGHDLWNGISASTIRFLMLSFGLVRQNYVP
jgi:hypothetical protein